MTEVKLTKDYQNFIEGIKSRILTSRYQAARAVNKELILLYHHIGTQILEKQNAQGWGAKVIEHLSKDLKMAFPSMKGFSVTNLKYMKLFAEAYDVNEISQQAADQLPWYHLVILLTRVKDIKERQWYIERSIQEGWSRDRLEGQIDSNLIHRQGNAITNFKQNLPEVLENQAQNLLKSPYNLDFLCLTEEAYEREIENKLVQHIEKFLIELGEGFAFMGRQYHLRVDEDDYMLDMLFYNVKLRCYVVVELKAVKFKPEFAGQLNFYLSAVDEQLKHENDNPTIGLLLCKSHNGVTAEYALRNLNSPIGVAEYSLIETLPKEMKTALPSIEQLEFELSKQIASEDKDKKDDD